MQPVTGRVAGGHPSQVPLFGLQRPRDSIFVAALNVWASFLVAIEVLKV